MANTGYGVLMEVQGCIQGVLDDSRYSSPIPVIGLYIAAASLVCLFAMLHDIISGLLHRKPWVPCRLFSLNSVTLTLLALAAKLPVDLTTPMPSAKDQMSKLTGTSIICVSMAFFMPSLGSSHSSECFTNLAALSIFVVTVVANICIQIDTGVIVLFVPEHIIVICCMLVTLVVFWFLYLTIESEKDFAHDHNKDLIRKGEGSMLERLKLAYLYGYNFNPQFIICKGMKRELVGLLCIPCVVVVIEAALRSLTLEFCGGISDYDWSMRIIVMTQILTILVGSLATGFRLLTLLNQTSNDFIYRHDVRHMIYANPLLGFKVRNAMCGMVLAQMQRVVGILMVLLLPLIPLVFLFACLKKMCKPWCRPDGDIDEYKHLIQEGDMKLEEWSLGKSVKDMKRWIGLSKSESLDHLLQLILKTLPPKQLDTMELKDRLHPDQEGLQVSPLSMVLLIRIIEVSIPSELCGSLVQAYGEAHEILHFISDRIHSSSFKNRNISQLAEAVWIGDDFSKLLPKIIKKPIQGRISQSQSGLEQALVIIKELKTTLPSDFVWDEVGVITDFVQLREYSSLDVLYSYMEQLVVDMLHIYLSQLPHAVFKEVTESPSEEFEERVKLALKFLCKMESLEAHIQWSFPVQSNMSSLISPELPLTSSEIDPLQGNNGDINISLDVSQGTALVIPDNVTVQIV